MLGERKGAMINRVGVIIVMDRCAQQPTVCAHGVGERWQQYAVTHAVAQISERGLNLSRS
jgi:hypothetical protein